MGKIWVEVSLISARGLRRSSSFWKLQWFAVGWIDPNNKYCTKIDASGNSNPVWKTKFATLFDDSNFQDMMLHVEVYSREPIFLREKLQGTATVALKEFLAKFDNHSHSASSSSRTGNGTEEVGSYQLRRRNSNKPQGFIDVSIRISEEREEPSSYPGNEGGLFLNLTDHSTNIALSTEGSPGVRHAYPTPTGATTQTQTQLPVAPFPFPHQANTPYTHTHSLPHPTNYYNSISHGEATSYTSAASGPPRTRTRTPPPPPPPSDVGYIPTFLPTTDHLSETYFNMPSSASASAAGPGRGPRPGVAMGLGAGALAAGAVIFGDDFMSGFDVPSGLRDASLTISTDRPF